MTPNSDPTNGCRGKKPYRTFTYAEGVASRSAELNGEPMHAYHCKRCNAFHVGAHMRPRRRPGERPTDTTEDSYV